MHVLMIVFYIEKSLQSCPKCGLSRYKVKDDDKENTDEVIKHNLRRLFGIY